MMNVECYMMNCIQSTFTINHLTFLMKLIAALRASPLGEEPLEYGSDIRETP